MSIKVNNTDEGKFFLVLTLICIFENSLWTISFFGGLLCDLHVMLRGTNVHGCLRLCVELLISKMQQISVYVDKRPRVENGLT